MNNIFLSVNLIGRVKKKRNDVTEIVSELEIADVIFRRYDRKYVCCSQANKLTTAIVTVTLEIIRTYSENSNTSKTNFSNLIPLGAVGVILK